jgi:outer membrane protein assembly factor BamB
MQYLLRPTEMTCRRALVALSATLALISACSKDKAIDEPAKITPLPSPSLRVQRVWSVSVDDKKAVALRLGLGISLEGKRVYAAGHTGVLAAFDVDSGRTIWRIKTKVPFAGGTAVSGDLLLVGTSDGQLLAFNATNGSARWKVRLNGEVLAPATISEHVIALRTVDGKLHGLSPTDGHELWAQEQQVPRLSLRGTARPVIVGDVVLCGFDNGRVMAVNGGDGSVVWEATVTPPHGRTELERLADIDSAVSVSGKDVYAVGFQGRVAMMALDTGQIWWSHETSSYRGLAFDDDTLYVATADGEVVALKARTGAEIWRQNALLHRRLSALALMDGAVVTGDFQGYVHFLDRASGALAARVQMGKVRISAAPVVAGNMVVVVNERGQIDAFRVTPLQRASTAPAAPANPAPAAATPQAPTAAPESSAPATTPAPEPPPAAAPPPQ